LICKKKGVEGIEGVNGIERVEGKNNNILY